MAIQSSLQGPQFTPAGGVGTVWQDPEGVSWEFTANGWKRGSTDIQKDVKEQETFEVKPDEEPLVQTLKSGGSSQEQINTAISERRKVLEGSQDIEVTDAPLSFEEYQQKAEELAGEELGPEDITELKKQYQTSFAQQKPTEEPQDNTIPHPFGGMTKKQVLRDAYNKGVTSVSELDKLEKLYDKLVDEDEDGNDDFTETEKRKLEQAGLLQASRQEKLDYLYGF